MVNTIWKNKECLAAPFGKFQKYSLKGGLRVILKAIPSSPVAAVVVKVKAGAVDERKSIQGISHFLEHIFFKGTKRYPLGQMDRIIKGLGGYNNASTSMESTQYYIVLPYQKLALALDLLLDAYLNPAMVPEEIERERKVILEELNRRDDMPYSKLSARIPIYMFPNTPYERTVLGEQETIKAINQQDLLNYYNSFYTPANTVISICGRFNTKEVKQQLTELLTPFCNRKNNQKNTRNKSFFSELKHQNQAIHIPANIQQLYWLKGVALSANWACKHQAQLDIVAALLGQGRGARLYQKLGLEQGLVGQISADFWEWEGLSAFFIFAITDKENKEKVASSVEEEIKSMSYEKISTDELERARALCLSQFIFANEKAISQANSLGQAEITNRLRELLHYQENINSVTKTDVSKIVSRLFSRFPKVHIVMSKE